MDVKQLYPACVELEPSRYGDLEVVLKKLDALCCTVKVDLLQVEVAVINEGLTNLSAHVRAKCLDVLAIRGHPRLRLRAGLAGDLVIAHTDDGDARVRERAYDCLRHWLILSRDDPSTTSAMRGGTCIASFRDPSECRAWMLTNVEKIYAAASGGLVDVELTVRCTSVLLLSELSTVWPNHELNADDLPSMGYAPTVGGQTRLICSTKTTATHGDAIRLADDAFSRICMRLQDSARQVRQLAAQVLADFAKCVKKECLVQTLEKTVMSDRQVKRSALDRPSATEHSSGRTDRAVGRGDTAWNRAIIMATGPSGAIISGLEDDFFEVRCATLATVTRVAHLSARFAANCQDLLVDMLTDDIQDVRFAAVRALGAVGDQVPLQSEQVAIITAALAEGAGRIRRRLHQLLSRCRLSSAPCLVSLLDGLLQNLRRYPRDRDSLWRCAASVGRRHASFVEICLPSLLRTHSWLSGPDPNWEDPAYLTVLVMVLNAEPGAPGMRAKFPRHLAATRAYLRELTPSLLPNARRPRNDDATPGQLDLYSGPTKRPRLDSSALPETDDSLHRYLVNLIRRIICLFKDVLVKLPQQSCVNQTLTSPTTSDGFVTDGTVGIRVSPHQLSLLSRLIFTDLRTHVQRLDHTGALNGLIRWLVHLASCAWCLIATARIAADSSSGPGEQKKSKDDNASPSSMATLYRSRGGGGGPAIVPHQMVRLLTKALRQILMVQYLFVGKTAQEHSLVSKAATLLFRLTYAVRSDQPRPCPSVATITELLSIINNLLSLTVDSSTPTTTTTKEDDDMAMQALHSTAERLLPVCGSLIQPAPSSIALSDDAGAHPEHPRLAAAMSAKLMNSEDAEDAAAAMCRPIAASHGGDRQSTMGASVPEVRFTATMATASIRLRAIVIGISLEQVRKSVCVLFRRPDMRPCRTSASEGLATMDSGFYEWWPPSSAWHLLDTGFQQSTMLEDTRPKQNPAPSSNMDRIELRSHLELTAARWSDAGTVELGLGYSVRHMETKLLADDVASCSTTLASSSARPLILPLTPAGLVAKVKLLPSAPISQW